jgi:hypothetical protein
MTQLQAGLVKLGLGSTDRATQVPGNFAVRQAFHLVHQEDSAIACRQLREGTPDGDPIDSSRKLPVLHRKQIQKRSFSMLGARAQLNRYRAMTVGAQAHKNYVYGQPVQPGGQSRVPAERGESQKTLQKCFLRAILRFEWFASYAEADGVHLASMSLIE